MNPLFYQNNTIAKYRSVATHFLLLLGGLCLFLVPATAQGQYELLLKGGTIVPEANLNAFIDAHQINSETTFDGYYYQFLQFEEMPTKADHQTITQNGIQLLEYLPHLTYLAAIPTNYDLNRLKDLQVRSVLPLTTEMKMDNSLLERPFNSWAVHGNKIGVILKYHRNLTETEISTRFQADGIELMESNGINNYIYAHIDADQIEAIAALPYVAYLTLEDEPGEPEDVEGRSLHRANALDTSFPGGRKYTGEGVKVMVRDDGAVGPHIDFQGRMNANSVFGDNGTHGDGVAGIMCGAGNLDPRNRGMAAGADMYVVNYQANFLDETLPLHISDDVLVTNSSYSNGCNEGYTATTATVDQQMNDYPTFLHVFSAGNSNNQDCGYGAGNQWGNITGGHKQGKNVIATANVFSDGSLVNSSSRGPAHDGRIKPDIAANGQNQISTDPNNQYAPFGGTSGAAPGIAGIAAQLHHAYRELNGGAIAEGALLKAIMMNSASDYGNVGPDFKFGWGIVNAYRAALTLEENRYLTGNVEQGATQTHSIEVPEGVSQVKVMTYWRERESSLFTNKSLINNLDTRVVFNGVTHLPWILDPTPNVTTLDLPAVKGVDDLNNVEQVAIDNPAAGTYTLEVVGTEVEAGSHDYFVIYEFITSAPVLTYPVGGEALAPNDTERIHWDAFGNDGNFTLSYSLDDGNTWMMIADVDGAMRMYSWNVPQEFTSKARVRVTRGAESDMTDATFSISPLPVGLKVNLACEEAIGLEWVEVDGATGYEVYTLGEKYMESIGITMTNSFQYTGIDILQPHWFAIRTLGPDDLVSRRTNAVQHAGGMINCVIPEITLAASNDEICALQNVDFGSTASEVGLSYSWDFGGGAVPPVSFAQNPNNIKFITGGTYIVTCTASNDLGSVTETIEITVIPKPEAAFEFVPNATTVQFTSLVPGIVGYNWNFGDGTGASTMANPQHVYSSPGTYTVTLNVFNICGNSALSTEVTVSPTSIDEGLLNFAMSIAPNPNHGIFELMISSAEPESLNWDMYNLQGQLLKQGQVNTTSGRSQKTINVSDLSGGVYLMRVSNEKGARTLKVLLQ